MNTIVKPFPKQDEMKRLKIDAFPNTYSIYDDIIIAQQSLRIPQYQYYFPFVDVSKRFEESIEKCRKKTKQPDLKIKAIENIQIPKTLSEKLIENYRKTRDGNDEKLQRIRCSSETTNLSSIKNNRRASELVDQLLLEIYGRSSSGRIFETEYCSSTSFKSTTDKFNDKLQYSRLVTKDITELQILITALKERVKYTGNLLVKHLKKREALHSKQEKICNVITATLQAHSSKTCEDTNMRFSPSPVPGDSGFNQWRDAMKMVARLPGGIPPEFRRKLWLALAEKHLQSKNVNWNQTEKFCFNEWSNPDDSELGVQIVKDLHRTGCSLFCGAAGQENQALLKRVLLAYARWNKSVGYCQGFNMLAALILQVMDKNETDSVKVMIYLIEGVLPESYFANNLRGLSVDMIVFRDLLKLRLPILSKHLELLQNDAREGNSYEPPLTNVFTMQWFLTLFCNCLPQSTVLRVWDLIFLEGNEILLRTAIAIWQKLSDRILAVNSADEFYSIMGVLTREMLEFGLVDSNTLIKSIVDIGPCPELNEMRDRYLYNITPWTQSVSTAAKKGFKLFYSDDDEPESDYDEKAAVTAAYGISVRRRRDKSGSLGNVIQPYAHGHPDRERLALDISALKKQYSKLRERQRQAHIILQAACARQPLGQNSSSSPIAMNHLLLGKNAILNSRGRRLGPPKGAIPPVRTKPPLKKMQSKEGETVLWKDTAKVRFPRRQSLPESCISSKEVVPPPPPEESDSSSYSDDDASSTSTELCDDPGKMSDFDSDDKTNELPKDAPEKDEKGKKKTEMEFKEIVADIDTLKIDSSKPVDVEIEVKHKFQRQSTIEENLISTKLEDIEETLDVTHISEEIISPVSSLAKDENAITMETASENVIRTADEEEITKDEFSNIQQHTSPVKEATDANFILDKKSPDLIDMECIDITSPESKNDFSMLQFLETKSSEDPATNVVKFEDNKILTHSTLVKLPSIEVDLPESKINTETKETDKTDLNITENSSNTNLINLNEFESNITANETEYDSNIEFETFLQERIQISKENSVESIKSPKEEASWKPPEEKFRRHKSYEETSTSNQIEKTSLFKQKSFDINNLPIIETTVWKPYGIEEESPKEEPVDAIFEEDNERPSVIKQTSVDLLTVEDKRFESGRRNSERALKIIQENSLILHRILLQQKSSEKEDSEDELSKSPISKTFLRSESLLSKDEKTDEERSSKDGEEEFLESGVESFSVSPALIEEENDVIHEEISDPHEDTILSKTDYDYSPSKDMKNNSVHLPDETPSKHYEDIIDPTKSTIFEENTIKITEICKSNNINISRKNETTSSINEITPSKEETESSKQNDYFNIPTKSSPENLNTFKPTDDLLLKFDETSTIIKDTQNYEDTLEEKIYGSNLSKTESYGNKSEYSLISPIDINTLKSHITDEDTYYNLEKSVVLASPEKENQFSSLDEILNKSKENAKKVVNTEDIEVTNKNKNKDEELYSYKNWQSSKDDDKTLDPKKLDEVNTEDIKETNKNKDEELYSYKSWQSLQDDGNSLDSKKIDEEANTKDIKDTNKNKDEELYSYKNWQSSKDDDKTLDSKKIDEDNYVPCYKYKNEEENKLKDKTLDSKKIDEDDYLPCYKYKIEEENTLKDNRFSLYESDDIEKPKSFYEGKYYTEYIDKLKEDKYILDKTSPLQPSKSITSSFLSTENTKSSNTNEKTSYLEIESPGDTFPSIKNKYSDFPDISKDNSYRKYDKEDTFHYTQSPRKTYLSDDDSYTLSKKDDYKFDKTSTFTKSTLDDTSSTKKEKSYLSLDSPDDFTTLYKDKKEPFDLKSKYSYDFDDKSSKKSCDLSYSSNEDKSDNNLANISYSSAQSHSIASPDTDYKRKQHLSIDLKASKTREYSPEVSPPKHLSCLQFTTFQADIPCTSKAIQLSPICSKEKSTSPTNSSSPTKTPKYLYSFNLPTLSPPRRTSKSPLSPDKCFNPFPVQPTTRQPKELGVRLGLYKDLSPLKSPSK